jgi:hypothetical protein
VAHIARGGRGSRENEASVMADDIPYLVTLYALSKALAVSPHTVRSWVRKKKLHPVRICRRLLFHPDEINRFLAEAMKAIPSDVEQ